MSESIIVAIISLCGTLIGVFISAKATQDKMAQQLEMAQAVTNNEIKHLTEEVKRHNAFAERIPQIEGELNVLNEKIKTANHRITDLENREKAS